MPVLRLCIICEENFREIQVKNEKEFITVLEADYICPNCKNVIDKLKKFSEKFNGPFKSGFKETKIWALAERLFKLYSAGQIKYNPYTKKKEDLTQPCNSAMWLRQVWFYVAQQLLGLEWLTFDKTEEKMTE